MIVIRELTTKFSFEVNSEAVKAFITLVNSAEKALDKLGGNKATKTAIKNNEKKTASTKKAVSEETKAKKEGIKKVSDAEKQAIADKKKAEKDAETARKKAEKDAEKARKQAESDRKKAQKEEQRYQNWLKRGSTAVPISNIINELKIKKALNALKDYRKNKTPEQNGNRFKTAIANKKIADNQIIEEQRYQNWLKRGSVGERARVLGMFSGMKFKRTGSEDLGAYTKKIKNEVNKLADNQINVEKRTQKEIDNIQKRWDNRKKKRRIEAKKEEERASKEAQKQAEKAQRTLQKETEAYENRRRRVLQRLQVSRLKRRIRNTNQSTPQPTPELTPRTDFFDTALGKVFAITGALNSTLQIVKTIGNVVADISNRIINVTENILRTNDYLNMAVAKIGVITGDTKNASNNFKELLAISKNTGSEIGNIEEIFNRLSMGKEGLNASTEQILSFTNAIAKLSAFSEGGAAQQGALRQLGQMFGGAYIQAQEWNSIVDGLPAVATKIAKAMGTTREAMTFKIRQQTKDSPAYLIKDVFPKLLKILPEIDAEFSKLPTTLDRMTNKAKVKFLEFSLALKESFGLKALNNFYTQMDKTIEKIFEWANANKTLIGTNINKFFETLTGVLQSVDTQLKDTKGTTDIVNKAFYLLNGTVFILKGTFDNLLATLKLIVPIMKWMDEHPTIARMLVGAGVGGVAGAKFGGIGAGVGVVGGGLVGLNNSPAWQRTPTITKPTTQNSQYVPGFGWINPNPQVPPVNMRGGAVQNTNNNSPKTNNVSVTINGVTNNPTKVANATTKAVYKALNTVGYA